VSAPVICQHLTKKFRSVTAVDDLSLEVPEGAIYALIGPNGAGKSTFIKTLVNITRPSSGSSSLLGADSRQLKPKDFAQLGYVSENQELPEWMTVRYFLNYLKPFYPTWDDSLATEMVEQFDLPWDRKLSQLSRGMKMKVALASSLAYRPKLIILDEPFSGLDPLVRDEFIQGLLERAAGATILISSHDLAEIESFASHVGFLDRGHLQFTEEINELTGRFRQVSVTLGGASPPPPQWPDAWLQVEHSPSVVRFVDSKFNEEGSAREIAALFPDAADVTVRPMALREIFVSLAKQSRRTR
jgi:ABC-2 type transport system ATP-binding protein